MSGYQRSTTDWAMVPKFDRSMLPTVVHEFCHSYVNPFVYAHHLELRAAGERMFPSVAESMQRQAYGNWTTMMHESLVRASVVRYQHAVEGEASAQKAIQAEVNRSFRWMPELSALLADYEGHRDRYPDFRSFFPQVIRFFDDNAEAFARREKEQEQNAPKVASMTPSNNDRSVDPALKSIQVTFDRKMREGFSFVGGGPLFPKTTGRASFDSDRRTATLPVQLEPDHDYEFWLNRGEFLGFRSDGGIPLSPVHVQFRTGAGK